jgi:hypothetical protein
VGKDFLDERTRAEDIILGSLGFGEEATLLEIHRTSEGFEGTGQWSDGEDFSFESEEGVALDDLEDWALNILTGVETPSAKIA